MISLDIETTGIDSTVNRIIEIGAIKFKGGKIIDKFQSLVNPECELPEIITHITGITQSELESAPKFAEVVEDLKKFVGKDVIIGHNIQFDIDFLQKEGLKVENVAYDTCVLSQLLVDSPSYSLETLTKKLGLSHKDKHRALDDSVAAMELFNLLQKELEKIPVPLIEELKLHVVKSTWPLRDIFLQAKGSKERQSAEKETVKKEAKHEINVELTDRILESFENERNFICEAGIGTHRKKSLVSAATIQAQKNHERIVIAVADHKSAEELLTYTDTSACILEPPSHYLSTKRLDEFKHKESFTDNEITLLLKLLLSYHKIKDGKISEFNLSREERVMFREHISCSEDEKEGSLYDKAKEKAIDSDIIIVGHRFLLSENEKLIPPYRYLIIDEVDKLEQAATQVETFVPEVLDKKYPGTNTDILFGLLGIFFEKYKPEDKTQLTMDEYHYRVADWQKICKAAANISEDLKEFFTEEYSENRVNWMYQAKDGTLCFRSAKTDIQNALKRFIEEKKSIVLTSSTIKLGDSYHYIRNTLGLDESFEEETYESKLQPGELLVEIAPRDFPPPNTEGNFNQSAKLIIEHILKNKKTAALFTSRSYIEGMYKKVAPQLKEQGITVLGQGVTGGYGKMIDAFENDENVRAIFGNFDFWNHVPLKDVSCLIINKIPFDHPDDPIFAIRAKRCTNSFEELSIPRALLKFRQAVYKLTKDNRAPKTLLILDTRVSVKDYGKLFLESIPKF